MGSAGGGDPYTAYQQEQGPSRRRLGPSYFAVPSRPSCRSHVVAVSASSATVVAIVVFRFGPNCWNRRVIEWPVLHVLSIALLPAPLLCNW